jgi:hypothetical protein
MSDIKRINIYQLNPQFEIDRSRYWVMDKKEARHGRDGFVKEGGLNGRNITIDTGTGKLKLNRGSLIDCLESAMEKGLIQKERLSKWSFSKKDDEKLKRLYHHLKENMTTKIIPEREEKRRTATGDIKSESIMDREALLKEAAEMGDAEAEYQLGDLNHMTGNPEQAEEWYKRATKQNHVGAMISLAEHYEQKKVGKEKEEQRAAALYFAAYDHIMEHPEYSNVKEMKRLQNQYQKKLNNSQYKNRETKVVWMHQIAKLQKRIGQHAFTSEKLPQKEKADLETTTQEIKKSDKELQKAQKKLTELREELNALTDPLKSDPKHPSNDSSNRKRKIEISNALLKLTNEIEELKKGL